MQNAKCRTDDAERGQRLLANYAEPQGGKACKAGLMQNAKCRTDDKPRAEGRLQGGTPITISVVPQALKFVVTKEFLEEEQKN